MNGDANLDSFLKDNILTELEQEKRAEKLDGWRGKVLYGQYPKKKGKMEIRSWNWLKYG